METMASIRDSKFETSCTKCGNALIAPEWSEYVSDGLVLNFWSCWKCGHQFETEAYMPVDAEGRRRGDKGFFPVAVSGVRNFG